MTEDIAFSTVLFYYANKVTTIQNEGYFYCQNGDASTNVENITIEKFEKNIKDVRLVFDFVMIFLKKLTYNSGLEMIFLKLKSIILECGEN